MTPGESLDAFQLQRRILVLLIFFNTEILELFCKLSNRPH